MRNLRLIRPMPQPSCHGRWPSLYWNIKRTKTVLHWNPRLEPKTGTQDWNPRLEPKTGTQDTQDRNPRGDTPCGGKRSALLSAWLSLSFSRLPSRLGPEQQTLSNDPRVARETCQQCQPYQACQRCQVVAWVGKGGAGVSRRAQAKRGQATRRPSANVRQQLTSLRKVKRFVCHYPAAKDHRLPLLGSQRPK
jgi:hypothetical protein